MQKMYSFVDNEHFVDIIRQAFADTLAGRGYHLVIDASGPGAPHVYEYRTDGAIVSVMIDRAAGEKWEAELIVETEGPEEELEGIVAEAVGGLLARISERLVRSVVDPQCRSAVVRELSRAVTTLE